VLEVFDRRRLAAAAAAAAADGEVRERAEVERLASLPSFGTRTGVWWLGRGVRRLFHRVLLSSSFFYFVLFFYSLLGDVVDDDVSLTSVLSFFTGASWMITMIDSGGRGRLMVKRSRQKTMKKTMRRKKKTV
jgi:hypothetical protein